MEKITTDMYKQIIQEFECPVCLDYMAPPIFVICMNGHNVCSQCAPNLDYCPTCRQPVQNIRNIAMENIARNVHYPCINQKWGCDEAFPVNQMANHQVECFHNRRCCPWAPPCGRCPWTGSTADLISHLNDSHADRKYVVEDGEELSLAISTYGKKTLLPEGIISTLDSMFIYCSAFMNNKFYCIVQYVGKKQDADMYKYKFCVSRLGGTQKISVTHTVSSDTVDLRQIRDEGECVHLPCDLLKAYCSDSDTEEDDDDDDDDHYYLFPVLKYSLKISEI